MRARPHPIPGVRPTNLDAKPRAHRYPTPEVPPPTDDEIAAMVMDSVVEATDGCDVEPDGTCEHGHPSWLLYLGFV